MVNKVKISIIIPCYNEERFLPQLFSDIEKLSTKNITYEVIVVDNGSTDQSVEIAKLNNAVVVVDQEANISKLRNIGAETACGDLYAFMDADCLPLSDWLDETAKYMNKEDVGMFGGIPLCPEDGTWVEKAWLGVSPMGVSEVGFICTANMIVKKRIFNEVSGFDENLKTGEDYDICQRIIKAGYKLIQDDKIAVVHLRYPKTLMARYKKEIWYGEEMFNILNVNPLYKPFWTSLLFGFSLLFLLSCIFISSFGYMFFCSIILFIMLPVISATYKIKQTNRYEYYFKLIMLYYVYLAGRFTSILKTCLIYAKRTAWKRK